MKKYVGICNFCLKVMINGKKNLRVLIKILKSWKII